MDKKFTYSLAGLQRVQDYQLDQLTSRLSGLKEDLRRSQEHIHSLENKIKDYELDLVRLIREQPTFWLEARSATSHYLTDCRTECQMAQESQGKIVDKIIRLMGEITESQKSKKLLERHKKIMYGRHRQAENTRYNMLLDEHVLRKTMLRQQQKRRMA